METIGELFELVKLGITERLTSPLLGTYIVSWCVWNYRIFLIIFSDEYPARKFFLIDTELYPKWDSYLYSAIAPLLLSLFFIYVYPFFAKYVYRHRLNVNRGLMEIRQRIEDEEPLTQEQARQLRLNMREQQREYQERMAALEQENEDLRKSMSSKRSIARSPQSKTAAEGQSAPASKPASPNPSSSSESEQVFRDVMSRIAKKPNTTLVKSELVRLIVSLRDGISETRAQRYADLILSRGVLDHVSYRGGEEEYRLSSTGRAYIVDNNLDK